MDPHPDLPSFAVLGPQPSVVVPAELRAAESPLEEWRVAGERLDLTVTPEISEVQTPNDREETADQLVTVRGQLRGEGAREVDSRGCRSERTPGIEPGKFRLVRDVCGWFGEGEGFAVIAVRPRRASGHGDERTTATLFSGGHALAVAEPRLSTAYAEDGPVVRAALELWLPERDKSDEDDAVQYPRRAAGEPSSPGTIHDVGQLSVHVQPFRWRSEGRDGAGVYLLVEAR